MVSFYGFVSVFFHFALSLYYSKIDKVGDKHIPKHGPVIFAGSHPNSLIDPLIIMTTCGRKVRTIAKSTIFSIPVIGTLVRWMGTIPVHRRQDFEGKVQNNEAAIHSMATILISGDCLCIFPEGISHDNSELSGLKTGFARAALIAANEIVKRDPHISPDTLITIIPVGLNYMEKEKFRSAVFVEFGEPICIDMKTLEESNISEEKNRQVVRRLTDTLTISLNKVTLTASSWDELRVLHLAEELYLDDPEVKDRHLDALDVYHKFLTVYRKIKGNADVQQLFKEVQDYRVQLDLLKVSDRDIRTLSLSKFSLLLKLFETVFLYSIIFPLSLPGLIIHGPLGILLDYLSHKLAMEKTGLDKSSVAHYRVLGAILFTPIVYAVIGVATWYIFGIKGVLPVIGTIFASGFVAIKFTPFTLTLRALGLVLKLFLVNVSQLKTQRRKLQVKVRDAVNEQRVNL
eukprot:TRINITY_DN5754_c0_g1_i1.p1 TRINITY_DN5754_c0_g1~~TRINITY_DN5754_c0_g1_i1.p1  ORF type:complete len:510 (+),score=65.21 TRINITY_DN5754_c0_g1_i1:158-1531(+)